MYYSKDYITNISAFQYSHACYGKSRKQSECDGQSGYTMHILDDLIDEIVRDIFSRMKGVSKSDVIKLRYVDELEDRKARLNMVKIAYSKEFKNLTILKSEVIKAIKGESSFSADTLSELMLKKMLPTVKVYSRVYPTALMN